MRHHYTTDPAERAADIADHTAEEVWKETGDPPAFFKTWERTYHASLRELVEQPPKE